MKEEIFSLIHDGLDSADFETRHSAKMFADAIERTTKILKEENAKHIKDDGSRYLKQLVFMTKYMMQNTELSIEDRMRTIKQKLSELERHQLHQIYVLHHLQKKGIAPKSKGFEKRSAKKSQKKPLSGKKHLRPKSQKAAKAAKRRKSK